MHQCASPVSSVSSSSIRFSCLQSWAYCPHCVSVCTASLYAAQPGSDFDTTASAAVCRSAQSFASSSISERLPVHRFPPRAQRLPELGKVACERVAIELGRGVARRAGELGEHDARLYRQRAQLLESLLVVAQVELRRGHDGGEHLLYAHCQH